MNSPIVIKNFLSKDEKNLLSETGKIFLRSNKRWFEPLGASPYYYSMYVTEAILKLKKKTIEEKLNKELLPTYSFSRIYTKYDELKKHTDRPECEYSVTVFVDSCGTYDWPIYMDNKAYHLSPGDAVIYKGCDFLHWREEFLGDWHYQIFLHYVDKKGQYSNHIRDKRKAFGDRRRKDNLEII